MVTTMGILETEPPTQDLMGEPVIEMGELPEETLMGDIAPETGDGC